MKILLNRLNRYEIKLNNLTNELNNSKEVSNIFYGSKIKEINKIYTEMQLTFTEILGKNVTKNYNLSVQEQIKRIKNYKFNFNSKTKTAIDNLRFKKYLNSDFSTRSLRQILSDGIGAFVSGVDQGKKTFLRFVNKTQQIAIEENKINNLIAKGFIDGGSVNKATSYLKNKLFKTLNDGKVISLVDKNGNTRNYKIKKYAELVARTKMINAQTQSTFDIAHAVGSDLVQMSSHNSNCSICGPLEGKIYSLSGNDDDFPQLDFDVPLHSNCEHSFTVVFREILESRGIQKYIDFANGTSEEHPTLTEYVPVSQRELK